MTKIVYFTLPSSLTAAGLEKLGLKTTEFLPIVGPTLEFTKKAKKITKISNPITATSRGIGVLFDFCFGKTGAVTIECVLWFSLSVAGGATGNIYIIAAGAEFGNMVLEEFLD